MDHWPWIAVAGLATALLIFVAWYVFNFVDVMSDEVKEKYPGHGAQDKSDDLPIID
jgi:hypothetical protein